MDDHEEEEEEERKAIWGRRKSLYYNADNVDYEVVNLVRCFIFLPSKKLAGFLMA